MVINHFVLYNFDSAISLLLDKIPAFLLWLIYLNITSFHEFRLAKIIIDSDFFIHL